MISDDDILHACRAHALTLAVCTTGATDLAATATGYTRATGSFLTDGFRAGMEVTPAGFPQTARGVITEISALAMTIKGGRTLATEASGRTLAVGMPQTFIVENLVTTPVSEIPDCIEEYLSGARSKPGLSVGGFTEAQPLYLLRFRAKLGTGTDGLRRYADAALRHFKPDTLLPCANGDVARVRSDVAPTASQILRVADRMSCTVTISLRLTSSNF